MRHPRALRLAVAVLLAALAAPGGLTACTGSGSSGSCPGTAQGTTQVQLSLVQAQCAQGWAPADGTARCTAEQITTDCQKNLPPQACCYDGLYPGKIVNLTVAFAGSDEPGPAYVCTGRHDALPLAGTHTGDAISASLDLHPGPLDDPTIAGAVLAACSASCVVTVHQQVNGTLTRDPASQAITFSGTLVETDTPLVVASCGACTGPCTATWTMAPPPPPK